MNENEQEIIEELEQLWDLMETEDFESVLREAAKYVDSEFLEVSTGASRLMGLTYFRQKKFQEAIPFFEKVATASGIVDDYFEIVISATLSGEIDKGKEAFHKVIEIEKSGESEEPSSIPFMRYYYTCALRDMGEFNLALDQINQLRTCYEQLQITDSNYVFTSGVPFFSDTMTVAIDVFKGMGKSFDSESWINDFSKALDTEGREYLEDVKKEILSL